MTSALRLKNEKGWFAAGVEVGKALTVLSDGAFKLFVYLCLQAPPDRGALAVSQLELAGSLQKGTQTIRRYLREMEKAGVCRLSGFAPVPYCRGTIEITDSYWPYHRRRRELEKDEGYEFVAAARRLLSARACVGASWSTADAILARQWMARGISLDRLEQAVLLGCTRKYVSWRNHQGQAPISSLRYFEPILEELEQLQVSADYWHYVRSRMERMEKLWIQRHRGADPTCDQSQLLEEQDE